MNIKLLKLWELENQNELFYQELKKVIPDHLKINSDLTISFNSGMFSYNTLTRHTPQILRKVTKEGRWPILIKSALEATFLGLPLRSCENFPESAEKVYILRCDKLAKIDYHPQSVYQLSIQYTNTNDISLSNISRLLIGNSKFSQIKKATGLYYLELFNMNIKTSQLMPLKNNNTLESLRVEYGSIENLDWCPDNLKYIYLAKTNIKNLNKLPDKLDTIHFIDIDKSIIDNIWSNLPNSSVSVVANGTWIIRKGHKVHY